MNKQQTENHAVCPVCRTPSKEAAWRYSEFRIRECPVCSLQFVHPIKETQLDFYEDRFDEKYFERVRQEAERGAIPSTYAYLFRQISRAADKNLGAGRRRVVEAGCGAGLVLAGLRDLGFDCYGIDFNPHAVKIATEYFGLNVETKSISDLVSLNRTFDLAILCHVLEHVPDPVGLLKSTSQLLSPGGLLVIEVPNPNYCRTRRMFYDGKADWNNYPPHHLTFWTPKALRAALSEAGLETLEANPRPYPETFQMGKRIENATPLSESISRWLALAMESVGRTLRLQGCNVSAVAMLPQGR